MAHARKRKESHVCLSYMVKQGILITPVLGEVLTNLAPLRMKHSTSVPAYHKDKHTWLIHTLSHVPSHIYRHLRCARELVFLPGGR